MDASYGTEVSGPERARRIEELDRSIGESAGNIAAAFARMLVDLGEFDALGGWLGSAGGGTRPPSGRWP